MSTHKPDDFQSFSTTLLQRLGNAQPNNQQLELLQQALSHVQVNRQLLFDRRLTKREIDCLFWVSKGNSLQEIAEMLGIQPTTVKFHRRSILKKLACRNMAQAVFEGMRFGYLSIAEESVND